MPLPSSAIPVSAARINRSSAPVRRARMPASVPKSPNPSRTDTRAEKKITKPQIPRSAREEERMPSVSASASPTDRMRTAGRFGGGRYLLPGKGAQDADQRGRQDMRQIEQQSGGRAAEDADAGRADDKGGAGVVTEGEQMLGLLFFYPSVLIEIRNRDGAQWITAGNTQDKDGGALAADTKEPVHERGGIDAEILRQAQAGEQPSGDKEGEEGGNDHTQAELQTGVGSALRLFGVQQQEENRRQRQGQYENTFSFHPYNPLVLSSLCTGRAILDRRRIKFCGGGGALAQKGSCA